jgi:arylsulfatase
MRDERDVPSVSGATPYGVGTTNLSCYGHGVKGYRTPNIDRLAREGTMFTDAYGEQSCTAGRSAFITGQSVFRNRPQ